MFQENGKGKMQNLETRTEKSVGKKGKLQGPETACVMLLTRSDNNDWEGKCLYMALGVPKQSIALHGPDQWYSACLVRVPPDVNSLQLCTPSVVGV
jgi:hypothetical protein